jgi:methyl-accepting chemotaxis protein
MTASVKAAADGAARADQEAGATRAQAEKSGEVVVQTVAAMDQIANSSERIASITRVIEDIAFQTNLLALNAGVEAARAGEAGRGFAVVASEVRALAQRCTDAAREINDLISESGGHVKRGVDLVGETGEALRGIVTAIGTVSSLVSEIAESSRQQSTGLTEINAAVTDLDQSTQQNAARLEETTAASQGLTNDANAMVRAVAKFRLKDGAAAVNIVDLEARRQDKDTGATAPRPAAPRPAAPPRRERGAAVAEVPAPAEDEGWSDY